MKRLQRMKYLYMIKVNHNATFLKELRVGTEWNNKLPMCSLIQELQLNKYVCIKMMRNELKAYEPRIGDHITYANFRAKNAE